MVQWHTVTAAAGTITAVACWAVLNTLFLPGLYTRLQLLMHVDIQC